MKKLAATVCAFLLALSFASAQSAPCVSGDPTAVPVDTLRTTLQVVSPIDPATQDTGATGGVGDSVVFRSKAKSNGQITLEIFIWRVQNGGIVYSIDPNSITFSGDGSVIDSMSTQMIFDLLVQAAIGQGLNAGYSSCSNGSCENNLVRISLPSCVKRTGRGVDTRFVSCEPESCCLRTYALCCPLGSTAPVLHLVGMQGNGCSGASIGSGCESLCE